MSYQSRDRTVWESIFQEAPDEWLSAPPSSLMEKCSDFFARSESRRILDVGSGFGRWSVYLARSLSARVVGVDYTLGGNRLANRLAATGASFATADVTRLPFVGGAFDGLLAVLLLDNMLREQTSQALAELERAAAPGAAGFFVFNPWPMPETDDGDNPTSGLTRENFPPEQIRDLLQDWRVLASYPCEHELRVYEVRAPG